MTVAIAMAMATVTTTMMMVMTVVMVVIVVMVVMMMVVMVIVMMIGRIKKRTTFKLLFKSNRFNISATSAETYYQWNPCTPWKAQDHPCEDAAVSGKMEMF